MMRHKAGADAPVHVFRLISRLSDHFIDWVSKIDRKREAVLIGLAHLTTLELPSAGILARSIHCRQGYRSRFATT